MLSGYFICFLRLRRPPRPPLFPYTTLFRSGSMDTAAHFGGFTDTLDYSLSAGYQSTDGTPDARFGSRDLASNNTAVSGKFTLDRKSTRLNSSHSSISYAVFCLKKKKNPTIS